MVCPGVPRLRFTVDLSCAVHRLENLKTGAACWSWERVITNPSRYDQKTAVMNVEVLDLIKKPFKKSNSNTKVEKDH